MSFEDVVREVIAMSDQELRALMNTATAVAESRGWILGQPVGEIHRDPDPVMADAEDRAGVTARTIPTA